MRARFPLAGLLTLLMLATGAPAAAGDVISNSSSRGQIAVSFWTDFPASGVPMPGAVYTNRSIDIGDVRFMDLIESGGLVRDRFTFAGVDEFTYTFDAAGELVPLHASNGSATAGELNFSSAVTSASADFVYRFHSCIPAPRPGLTQFHLILCGGGDTPTGSGTGSVSVNWVGVGDLMRLSDPIRAVTPCFTSLLSSQFVFRDATASAVLNGQPIGSTDEATLARVGDKTVLVSHFPYSMRPWSLCLPPPPPPE